MVQCIHDSNNILVFLLIVKVSDVVLTKQIYNRNHAYYFLYLKSSKQISHVDVRNATEQLKTIKLTTLTLTFFHRH